MTLPAIKVPPNWIGPRRRGEGVEETEARRKWMVGLLAQGHTSEDIAAAVRISVNTVHKARMKINGTRTGRQVTPKPKLKRNPLEVDTSTGFEIRRGLTDETQYWLIDNCPDGVTIGAFIASIVTDAHAEETDAGDV